MAKQGDEGGKWTNSLILVAIICSMHKSSSNGEEVWVNGVVESTSRRMLPNNSLDLLETGPARMRSL